MKSYRVTSDSSL